MAKGNLNEFIAYLEEQVKNHSIYIWGAQGQGYPTLTESWIKKKESGSNLTNALKTYNAAVKAGFEKSCKAFDCSGLGMYWLQNLKKLSNSDMNANGMKGKCTIIQKNHVKKGDWLFRCYTSGSNKGRAYHIGYMVSDTDFVEARGRAYGVVKRKLADVGTYWNTFGRPSYFIDDIDTKEEQIEHASFNRVLKKGFKGDDVRELQILLNGAGDSIGVDGSFGSKTQAAIKAFQKRIRLAATGTADARTIAALITAQKDTKWAVSRNLKKGLNGEDVEALQSALSKAGYDLGKAGVDGDFGNNTDIAVRAFQSAKKLTSDGVAGKKTVTALGGIWIQF